MARIKVRARGDRYWITLSGRLAATDLRRLERACGPALEHREVPIVVHLERVTDIDPAALGFLDRLAERGASIVRDQPHAPDRTS